MKITLYKKEVNMEEKIQIAKDIFISDLKIKDPYLDFTNPWPHFNRKF